MKQLNKCQCQSIAGENNIGRTGVGEGVQEKTGGRERE